MNRYLRARLAVALIVAFALPHAATAGEEEKTLREQCRSVAEGHGVQADSMDSWIERCVENATRIRKEREAERHVAPNPHGAPEEGGHGH